MHTHAYTQFAIVARTCFVRQKSLEENKTPLPVDYPLNSRFTLLIDGYTRCGRFVSFRPPEEGGGGGRGGRGG